MKLTVVPPVELDALGEEFLADAAGRGIHNLTVEHFRRRNQKSNGDGIMPKSNYYADAAESTTVKAEKKTVTVTVDKEGVALHYYGGTVLPKKRALAIPKNPVVAGVWPSELGGSLDLVWPKGKKSGTLRDKATGKVLYLLVPKATIPADKTVLPTDEEYYNAAGEAIMEAMAV